MSQSKNKTLSIQKSVWELLLSPKTLNMIAAVCSSNIRRKPQIYFQQVFAILYAIFKTNTEIERTKSNPSIKI